MTALAILSAFVILYWAHAFSAHKELSRLTFAVINTTVPTFCLAVSYFMANKTLKYVELHGPILFGSFLTITVILYATQVLEMDAESNIQTQSLSVLYYTIYIGFMNPQFLRHFIIRGALFVP